MPYVAGFMAWPYAGSNLTRENVDALTECTGEARYAIDELLKGSMRQNAITVDPDEGGVEPETDRTILEGFKKQLR